MWTDGQTDAGVTGILLAHPLAFGSGVKNVEKQISLFWGNSSLRKMSLFLSNNFDCIAHSFFFD